MKIQHFLFLSLVSLGTDHIFSSRNIFPASLGAEGYSNDLFLAVTVSTLPIGAPLFLSNNFISISSAEKTVGLMAEGGKGEHAGSKINEIESMKKPAMKIAQKSKSMQKKKKQIFTISLAAGAVAVVTTIVVAVISIIMLRDKKEKAAETDRKEGEKEDAEAKKKAEDDGKGKKTELETNPEKEEGGKGKEEKDGEKEEEKQRQDLEKKRTQEEEDMKRKVEEEKQKRLQAEQAKRLLEEQRRKDEEGTKAKGDGTGKKTELETNPEKEEGVKGKEEKDEEKEGEKQRQDLEKKRTQEQEDIKRKVEEEKQKRLQAEQKQKDDEKLRKRKERTQKVLEVAKEGKKKQEEQAAERLRQEKEDERKKKEAEDEGKRMQQEKERKEDEEKKEKVEAERERRSKLQTPEGRLEARQLLRTKDKTSDTVILESLEKYLRLLREKSLRDMKTPGVIGSLVLWKSSLEIRLRKVPENLKAEAESILKHYNGQFEELQFLAHTHKFADVNVNSLVISKSLMKIAHSTLPDIYRNSIDVKEWTDSKEDVGTKSILAMKERLINDISLPLEFLAMAISKFAEEVGMITTPVDPEDSSRPYGKLYAKALFERSHGLTNPSLALPDAKLLLLDLSKRAERDYLQNEDLLQLNNVITHFFITRLQMKELIKEMPPKPQYFQDNLEEFDKAVSPDVEDALGVYQKMLQEITRGADIEKVFQQNLTQIKMLGFSESKIASLQKTSAEFKSGKLRNLLFRTAESKFKQMQSFLEIHIYLLSKMGKVRNPQILANTFL